jgi:putative ABC transport system permease protein
MSRLRLAWAGLWRKPLRTLFTMASIAVAFLLFGLLQGVDASFDEAIDTAGADRLYVRNHISDFEGLPISALAPIEAVPGITDVAYQVLFPGYYRDPANPVVGFAVDAARFFKVNASLAAPPDALQAMARTRTGILVGGDLARAQGWKVGDRIPLHSAYWVRGDGSLEWTFDVVGIFGDKEGRPNYLTNGLLINYGYLDEARAFGKGMVGVFLVNVADRAGAAGVADTIDARFANSSSPTKTETIKNGIGARLKQIGDIKFMVRAIVAAVFFALLFLTANTTMQSVRERIPEFAVLKTLGFRDRTIAAIVVGEVFLLYGAAALAGLALAALVLPEMVPGIGVTLPASVLVAGIALAALLAVLTGAVPAWRLNRVNLVEALSGR